MVRRVNELVVNWHLLEECNFDCSYCFSKWGKRGARVHRDLDASQKIISEICSLRESCIETLTGNIWAKKIRLNFAGGEPFLARRLPDLIELAWKEGLSPSFITNGSLVSDAFIRRCATMVSVAGFSMDSANAETMQQIGRAGRNGTLSSERLGEIVDSLRNLNPNIRIKINTVVCSENANEEFWPVLQTVKPDRWKVLRVLPYDDIQPVGSKAFRDFVARHHGFPGMVVEDNDDMQGSYLMLDPDGRFFVNTNLSRYSYSSPIQDCGIRSALRGVPFEADRFSSRYTMT